MAETSRTRSDREEEVAFASVYRSVESSTRTRKKIQTLSNVSFMKAKILIVEDDSNILLGLEVILKGEGYEVSVCQRGDEALEAIAHYHPDLIVLDVMLPGLSGYDVCGQLRTKKILTPILMLTA